MSTHLNLNNHGLNQSITTTTKSYRNPKYDQNYDRAAGDINRNATVSQAEYQRDACEEELYRLRYGIENLLANNEQGDFRERQRQRFEHDQNPFRTMTEGISDLYNRNNRSWLDQCSPCCRRWRRNRYDDSVNIPHEYAYHRVYNERHDDLPLRRTHEASPQSQLYSNSFVSTSPSPSISPRYIAPSNHQTKHDLRRSVDHLISGNPSTQTNISDLLRSTDMNDPIYNSLIIKILEAKALDCLCTGYSKQNTQKQISQALSQINHRVDERQEDSESVTSSRSSLTSYESSTSSSAPSISTNDQFTSRSFTPQQYSPSPSAILSPSVSQTTPIFESPDKIKNSFKLNEDIKLPEKKSKITKSADQISRSSKTKKKKKPSSNKKKKPSSKNKKSTAKHRKKSSKPTKKRKKSKTPKKKPSSSISRKKKGSSKSPSRTKTRKKHKSKHKKKSSTKKRTKPKSNNQINDHETVISPTLIYPQLYQEIYRNRQRFLKLLL